MSNNTFIPYTQTSNLTSALFNERKIFLIDEVDSTSMGVLLQSLMYLDSISNEPIELYINSPGGEICCGMAVYRYMTEQMKSPLHTYCIGLAASMGSILYLAGEKRYIYEGCTIITHDPFSVSGNCEDPNQLKDRLESLERSRTMLCKIISERTGHTIDEISQLMKKDRYFDAEESLKSGISTDIIKKEATDIKDNPFVYRPDSNTDQRRGLPPPTERYYEEPVWNPDSDDIIIPAVPNSLLHIRRKNDTTVFRFGFSYRIEDDGRVIYANIDILPSQTKFDNFKYHLDLGPADKTYECELSDGSGTVTLTALEIGRLYKDGRNKYLANKVKRSTLANR